MTDADLTLRDEVAEVLCAARCGDDAPAAIPEALNPRWRVAACFVHQRDADALLPLLARVREEGRRDGAADVIAYPEQVLEQARREGEARVRAVLAGEWLDEPPSALYPEGRRLYRWPADLRDQLRAALDEPGEGDE